MNEVQKSKLRSAAIAAGYVIRHELDYGFIIESEDNVINEIWNPYKSINQLYCLARKIGMIIDFGAKQVRTKQGGQRERDEHRSKQTKDEWPHQFDKHESDDAARKNQGKECQDNHKSRCNDRKSHLGYAIDGGLLRGLAHS